MSYSQAMGDEREPVWWWLAVVVPGVTGVVVAGVVWGRSMASLYAAVYLVLVVAGRARARRHRGP